MVLTVFTWRYGGREVYLYGSYNGWGDGTVMNSMNGSTMDLSAAIDLPPGYHQYKFLVDGTWQVDEEQLRVIDEHGVINNLIFVEEPSVNAQRLPPEAVRGTLDLDSIRDMQLEASSSGVLPNGRILQLPEDRTDASRHRLFVHLSSFKAHDLMPNSGKALALDTEVAVKQAFHIMYEQGLPVMPLWDEQNSRISGMLTASDFILILLELHQFRALLTDEELEMHTISSWKNEKLRYQRDVAGALLPLQRRELIQVGPDDSLTDVALTILRNEISSVPVIHSPEDGSCPQLLHIACLAGILKHICRHFRHCLQYLPLLQQSICNLPVGTWTREFGWANNRTLLTLHASSSLGCALNLLIKARISSIPIVNDNGVLINIYSRSDITSLANGSVYAHIQPDQTMLSQVLEVLNEAGQDRYRVCTRFAPLYTVMEVLSDPAVRRIVVIDSSTRRVEGIVTLRDVFNLILS
nr:sucrose nonfermenting 4-like protein isoform X1 [Ipomoea batatas]